jgi:aryl-alcohol dehydrogenase-like predicted oxidoreductase
MPAGLEDQLETTDFGKTERTVSRLGFGGAPAGLRDYVYKYDPDEPVQTAGAIAAIRRAYELGVTYYDTAPTYGDGRSEKLFGEGLSGVPAKELFIATKCHPCTASEVRRSLEQSLINLKRDRIDLLQIHGTVPDEDIDLVLGGGGMLNEMVEMRSEGLISHIGFTTENHNRALYRLLDTGQFESIQISYNVLFQHPYDPEFGIGVMFEARERGMGVVTMRSLSSGIFPRVMKAIRPDDEFDYTRHLLQFTLSNPLVDVVLAGMRTVREVEQNVAIANDLSGRMDIARIHQHYPEG